ncbi:hypothetical protein G6F24_017909 [Rhizopus arrhizus]|nr:hypothetical protein G6F24_017909 [Rhizopus arrhizus]
MLTFSAVSPARCQPGRRRGSSVPLVVMATLRMPGTAATVAMISSRSLRRLGAPPVRRILLMPSAANARTSRAISSTCRKRGRPSAW